MVYRRYVYVFPILCKLPKVLEAVESLSRFYLAVAFHDVGMNSKDPRVRHVRIAFEKVKHFREAKQAIWGRWQQLTWRFPYKLGVPPKMDGLDWKILI